MLKLFSTTNADRAALLLRLGLAVVFLYAAFSSLLNPVAWAGFLPEFILKTSYAYILLKMFAVYEIFLAIWILSNKFTRFAAFISVVTLGGIVLVQPSALLITFRDIGLIFMAAALAVLAK